MSSDLCQVFSWHKSEERRGGRLLTIGSGRHHCCWIHPLQPHPVLPCLTGSGSCGRVRQRIRTSATRCGRGPKMAANRAYLMPLAAILRQLYCFLLLQTPFWWLAQSSIGSGHSLATSRKHQTQFRATFCLVPRLAHYSP